MKGRRGSSDGAHGVGRHVTHVTRAKCIFKDVLVG